MCSNLNLKDSTSLIPVIIQNSLNYEVLMLGYMNQEAFDLSKATGYVHFFSRSRNKIWKKGETSNNFLKIDQINSDCDNDALLILATPLGPTCHNGTTSCFSSQRKSVLSELEDTIQQRATDRPQNSYVSSLINSGIERIAQKIGEEGVEVAIAAVAKRPDKVVEEAADLIFHLLVLLKATGLSWFNVMTCLKSRMD